MDIAFGADPVGVGIGLASALALALVSASHFLVSNFHGYIIGIYQRTD